jgi:hypothetical protein
MAKLNTKAASKTHRIIVYGAPKTGKTQLAGALAEHYKMIWVDLENGFETLFKLPEKQQSNIELISLPDSRDFPIAAETCLKMVRKGGLPITICEEHGKVACMVCRREEIRLSEESDTPEPEEGQDVHNSLFVDVEFGALGPDTIVVFDSLTQLSNSFIAHITKKQADDYKLEFDDWGNLGKLLDIFLSAIQIAKYNVIVISHEQEIEGENKKKSLTPVGGTKNYSRNVAKFFDHVVYAERKNRKHVFASGTDYATNILTGSRTDIKLEDAEEGEASLLAIFKPELFANTAKAGAKVAKPSAGGSSQAILDRLKNKNK